MGKDDIDVRERGNKPIELSQVSLALTRVGMANGLASVQKERNSQLRDGLADRLHPGNVFTGHPSRIEAKLPDSFKTSGDKAKDLLDSLFRLRWIDRAETDKTAWKARDGPQDRVVPHDA